jgi:hypothetical protein
MIRRSLLFSCVFFATLAPALCVIAIAHVPSCSCSVESQTARDHRCVIGCAVLLAALETKQRICLARLLAAANVKYVTQRSRQLQML